MNQTEILQHQIDWWLREDDAPAEGLLAWELCRIPELYREIDEALGLCDGATS